MFALPKRETMILVSVCGDGGASKFGGIYRGCVYTT
jgi:hypothetical protein